jgi:hypothetical protein
MATKPVTARRLLHHLGWQVRHLQVQQQTIQKPNRNSKKKERATLATPRYTPRNLIGHPLAIYVEPVWPTGSRIAQTVNPHVTLLIWTGKIDPKHPGRVHSDSSYGWIVSLHNPLKTETPILRFIFLLRPL